MGSSVFLKTGNYAKKKKVIEHLKSNQMILPGSKIPMQENKNHAPAEHRPPHLVKDKGYASTLQA